jgi:uncharacterized protein (DUF1697 family)
MIYFAFLRAINVGGRTVPMAELRDAFRGADMRDISSYIQTGNLVFDSDEQDPGVLASCLESAVRESFGLETVVLLRSEPAMATLLEEEPFTRIHHDPDDKRYVSFLADEPSATPKLPMRSDRDGLELFAVRGVDAFCLSRPVRGRYGFPNLFIEESLGVTATTRNWNTIEKMWRRFGPG